MKWILFSLYILGIIFDFSFMIKMKKSEGIIYLSELVEIFFMSLFSWVGVLITLCVWAYICAEDKVIWRKKEVDNGENTRV